MLELYEQLVVDAHFMIHKELSSCEQLTHLTVDTDPAPLVLVVRAETEAMVGHRLVEDTRGGVSVTQTGCKGKLYFRCVTLYQFFVNFCMQKIF